MDSLKLRITPQSPFGTPLAGDTLFGNLCWRLLHRYGESRLKQSLEGYTAGSPFLVVSSAMPADHLPLPAMPLGHYLAVEGDPKQLKKRRWLPLQHQARPVKEWLKWAVSDLDAGLGSKRRSQPHNSIDRRTSTTGNGFAPYTMEQVWYTPETRLDLYLLFDSDRIGREELLQLVADLGSTGFGRDASIGLGRFSLESSDWNPSARGRHWLSLGPCVPKGSQLAADLCWYQPVTRYGKHGDQAVHSGKPFKAPVLMLEPGALLTTCDTWDKPWIGQGLGGGGQRLSNAQPATVHQGYTPLMRVRISEEQDA